MNHLVPKSHGLAGDDPGRTDHRQLQDHRQARRGGHGGGLPGRTPVIGSKVAIKAIHPELSRNPEVVSRFMTEAKSVNQIGNEHIVDVSDFGNTPDGRVLLHHGVPAGRVAGGPPAARAAAARRAARWRSPPRWRTRWPPPTPTASSTAISSRRTSSSSPRGHAADFVKVLDFGLAKLTQGEEKVSHKTRTGSVMGTPYYMSPEQCEGKAEIDHRADIYSLGVILFEMMTGRVPFGGEGYGEIIVKHLTMPPPAPRDINPAITPAQQSGDPARAHQAARRALLLDGGVPDGDARSRGLRGELARRSPPRRRQDRETSAAACRCGWTTATRVTSSACPCPPPSATPARSSTRRWKSPARARGWCFGVLAAAAVAAGAAVFLMKQSSGDPLSAAAAQTAPADPTPPPATSPPALSAPDGEGLVLVGARRRHGGVQDHR